MKLATIVKWSFIISFIITLVVACRRIIYSESTEILQIVGLIVTLIFIVSAIYEVRTSNRIQNSEKTMWTIALIFAGVFAGFIYFFIGRKRIAKM